MLAAVQRFDGEIIALQTTKLDWSGAKAAVPIPRNTIGSLGNGAVRLAAPTSKLGLAEGTETALAASQLSGIPCWASMGAGRMHKVMIPDAVSEVHVFADNDLAGRNAAESTSARHTAEGRRVVVRFPPESFNDYCDVAASLANGGRHG
jgi:hypothetical protein